MRFQATVIAFAASLAFAGAQDLSSVPQCAIPCFVAALPDSGCAVTDIKCQCTTGKDKIQASLEGCAPQRCSADESAALIPAVQKICADAGVSVEVPSALSTAAAAASSAASAAVSGVTGSASPTMSMSATASMPAQQSTAAGVVNVVGFGAVAAGVAAAFF